MPTLLYIQASPRGTESFSTQVAESFLDSFRSSHRDYGVERLDLFHADLPPFEAPQAAAKYAVIAGQTPQGAAAKAWKAGDQRPRCV